MGQILSRRPDHKSSAADCEAWPQLCSKDNVHVFIESVQGCLEAQKKARKRDVQSREHIGGLSYTVHRKIGSGEFSEVFEASRLNATRRVERYAIKIYRSRNLDRQKCMREEIKVLQKLGGGCKEIVGLHQCQENLDAETGTLEIKMLMDLCQGGSLRQLLKTIPSLDEQKTKIIGFQLVQALHYLHTRRVIHCDVKPENILFVNKGSLAVKLADFGNAKMSPNGFTPPRSTSFTMSDIYMAPEILQESAYGTPADMWSLGITLYQCLTNRLPFETGTTLTMEVLEEICTGSFIKKALSSELFPDYVSLNAVLFLEKLLRVDANERMNVIEALNHKWLKSMDVVSSEAPSRETVSNLVARPKTQLKMFDGQFRPQQLPGESHFATSQQNYLVPSQQQKLDSQPYNNMMAEQSMYQWKKQLNDHNVRTSSNYSTTTSSPSFEMQRGTSESGVAGAHRTSRAVQAFNTSFQELQARDRETTAVLGDEFRTSLGSKAMKLPPSALPGASHHLTSTPSTSKLLPKTCSSREQFQLASSLYGQQPRPDKMQESLLYTTDHHTTPLSTPQHLPYRQSQTPSSSSLENTVKPLSTSSCQSIGYHKNYHPQTMTSTHSSTPQQSHEFLIGQ